MDLFNTRRTNLRYIVDSYLSKRGSKSEFAAKAGLGNAHMSHLIAEPPHRNIGEKVARKIEGCLGLPVQWLDIQHSRKDLASGQNIDGFNLENLILDLIKQKAPTKTSAFTLVELGYEFLPQKMRMKSAPETLQQMVFDETQAKGIFNGRDASELRLYTVVGDAMLPTIRPGDSVILDISCHPDEVPHDGIYLFTYGEQLHLKRLQIVDGNIRVISSNKEYESWNIPLAENERSSKLTVVGLVLGKVGVSMFA